MGDNNNYVATLSPDKDKLAEMLSAMKGPSRTMAQFAEECAVGPSTLSRISNGRITKPLSVSVIESIYQHRDENADVSLDQFYHANGYVLEDEISRRSSAYDYFNIRLRSKEDMKAAITNELFIRGIQIQRLPLPHTGKDLLNELTAPLPTYIPCDIAVKASIDGQSYDLGFFIIPETAEPTGNEREDRRFIRTLFRRYALIFLTDAWEEERKEDIRMTFVFRSYPYHVAFVKALEKAPLRSAFTSVCLKPDLSGVYEEVGLGKNGANIQGIMNTEPLVFEPQNNAGYDEWDDEGEDE